MVTIFMSNDATAVVLTPAILAAVSQTNLVRVQKTTINRKTQKTIKREKKRQKMQRENRSVLLYCKNTTTPQTKAPETQLSHEPPVDQPFPRLLIGFASSVNNAANPSASRRLKTSLNLSMVVRVG